MEFSIDGITLSAPILASAMDAIVSPSFASAFSDLGGMAVMNLEGVQTKYDDPDEMLEKIVSAPGDTVSSILQNIYAAPVQESLVRKRIQTVKTNATPCAVSVTPTSANRLAPIAADAGADVIVIQSTVTTARHISNGQPPLVLSELLEDIAIPVIVGNCVTRTSALELMATGASGIIVGVGPGAACTTREVTGVGVPQVTATLDCASARNEYFDRTGKYVPIITDGGIRTGGDLCKAFACGADAVMIGTPLAQAEEAPGQGFNWGMASPHPALPRGTRVEVGTTGTLKQILSGPTSKADGTQNLLGALQICMGMIGAFNIRNMHNAEVVSAPSIKTEGKHLQRGLEF
jgi:IMP dehydrogenase